MKAIKMNPAEIEVAKAALKFKSIEWKAYPLENTALDEMMHQLTQPVIELTPRQRAAMTGIVREHLIYPNEDLFTLKDFDASGSLEVLRERMKKVDIGLSVVNKLKSRNDATSPRLKNTIKKIDSLLA